MGKAVIPKMVPYYRKRIKRNRIEIVFTRYDDSFKTVMKLLRLLKKDKLPFFMIENDDTYTIEWSTHE
jgi:hypothetical protein